ncbi:hypothetical protein GPECTOR_93g628 [Gonium pectorale]|uniref:Uncharacterized protein n=1 Tax=Gonium pectorale TaxID=33097 RepID=A0A150G0J5_GONPE|nr:hypothetical protein GPECTOR_93g628 [Gonium pectorale]|eukprot:KXZ43358.1 hypothetical protein GPECTOR_93g628 [Gonium pectorale]
MRPTLNTGGRLIIGGCSVRCGCNRGVECYSDSECGQGLFCKLRLAGELGSCQPCSQCLTDDMAFEGACFPKCPHGPIAALLGRPAAGHYSDLGPTDLLLATAAVDLAFALTEAQRPLSVPLVVVTAAQLRAFVTNHSYLLGDRATFQNLSYVSYSVDNIFRAAGVAPGDDLPMRLRALCVPCLPAQYCPQGTVDKEETVSDAMEKIRRGQGPIRGNYCPENSTTYTEPCTLAVCPGGTSYTRGSATAGLLFAFILCGTAVWLMLVKFAVWAIEFWARYDAALGIIQHDLRCNNSTDSAKLTEAKTGMY